MWYEIGRRAWSCCLSCELAPRSSRVGRAWVRSASRRLWMYPLGCLSAPSDLCSHLREPLLCSAFVSRVCVCHRSEPNAWTMACPCGPSCACFSAFRCQRRPVASEISQSKSVRSAQRGHQRPERARRRVPTPLPSAARRFDSIDSNRSITSMTPPRPPPVNSPVQLTKSR